VTGSKEVFFFEKKKQKTFPCLSATIAGVAVWGPGLEGWEQARDILAGERPYVHAESPPPAPAILSPTERRRTGTAVRLALVAAQQATEMAGLLPDTMRSVFGSANGDGAVVHAILDSLSSGERAVSPTQFHNSVHNAAAGYWTIATGSATAATCLGCHDATFAAALLKAMAEVATEQQPVLLCVYDTPLPPPLAGKRPTQASFAAAFVLLPPGEAAGMAVLDVNYCAEPVPAEADWPLNPALRPLARNNPAARALRLLEALARGIPDSSAAELLQGRIDLRVTPCSTATPSCA